MGTRLIEPTKAIVRLDVDEFGGYMPANLMGIKDTIDWERPIMLSIQLEKERSCSRLHYFTKISGAAWNEIPPSMSRRYRPSLFLLD